MSNLNTLAGKIFIFLNAVLFFLLLILFSLTNWEFLPKLLVIKDLIIFLILFLCVLAILLSGKILVVKGNESLLIICIIWLFFLCLSFIVSPAELKYKTINLRQYNALVLSFLSFNLLQCDLKDTTNMVNFTRKILIVVVLFGFIEYCLPLEIWENIFNIRRFWLFTGVDPWAEIPLESSGRFYSWDLLFLVQHKIRRMVSIFADPTLLAGFLYAILPFILFKPRKTFYDYILLITTIIVGFLTISKAFILALFIFIIFIYAKPNVKYYVLTLCCLVILSLFVDVNIEYGFIAHLRGAKSGIGSLFQGNILGQGLGNAGNYSSFSKLGSESGFGSLCGQVGIMAFIYIYFLYEVLKKLSMLYYKSNNYLFKASYVSVFTWVIIFFFSGSSLGLTGNGIIFAIAGALTGNKIYKEVFNDEKNFIFNPSTSLSSN